MKRVTWTDGRGKKHISLIRDNDKDENAKFGIPQDPPDISGVLDEAKIELHNALVERGLVSYKDVLREQNAVTNAITATLRSKIISLYKQKDMEVKNEQ